MWLKTVHALTRRYVPVLITRRNTALAATLKARNRTMRGFHVAACVACS
jgi:hypothetical protein